MGKTVQDIVAAAGRRHFTTAQLDAYLLQVGVTDVTQRIAVKHFMESTGQLVLEGRRGLRASGLQTDEPLTIGTLATDRPAARYAPAPEPVSREMQVWLRRASLDPTQSYTERQLDEALATAGLETVQRIAIKSYYLDRARMAAGGGLQAGGRRRTMSGSAATGTRIPGTLRGCSW